LTPSITVRPGYVSQPISTLGLGKAALSGVIVAGLLLTLIAVYFYIDLNAPTISPPTTSSKNNQPTPPPEREKVQPLDQNTNEEAKVRLVEEEKRLKEEMRKLEQSRLDDERSRRESAELEARRKRKEEQDFKEAFVRQDAERARLDDEQRRRVEEERRLYEERLAAASREELSRKIDSILAEGDSCFASMKFDCSISMAKAALSLAPNDVRAQRLRDQALAAQRRALGQIVIQ
jgi:cell division protein FtsN